MNWFRHERCKATYWSTMRSEMVKVVEWMITPAPDGQSNLWTPSVHARAVASRESQLLASSGRRWSHDDDDEDFDNLCARRWPRFFVSDRHGRRLQGVGHFRCSWSWKGTLMKKLCRWYPRDCWRYEWERNVFFFVFWTGVTSAAWIGEPFLNI